MYAKYYLLGNTSGTILWCSLALAGCGISLFGYSKLAPHRGGGAGAPRGTRGVAGGRKKDFFYNSIKICCVLFGGCPFGSLRSFRQPPRFRGSLTASASPLRPPHSLRHPHYISLPVFAQLAGVSTVGRSFLAIARHSARYRGLPCFALASSLSPSRAPARAPLRYLLFFATTRHPARDARGTRTASAVRC